MNLKTRLAFAQYRASNALLDLFLKHADTAGITGALLFGVPAIALMNLAFSLAGNPAWFTWATFAVFAGTYLILFRRYAQLFRPVSRDKQEHARQLLASSGIRLAHHLTGFEVLLIERTQQSKRKAEAERMRLEAGTPHSKGAMRKPDRL